MPIVAALAFLGIMRLVAEPARLRVNALIVAGASGAYLNGSFGPWELVYAALALAAAYRAQRSYLWVGVCWAMHSAWDTAHHLRGEDMLAILPGSSFGCALCDAVLAAGFIAGAATSRGR